MIMKTVDETITDDESSYTGDEGNNEADATKIPTDPTNKT